MQFLSDSHPGGRGLLAGPPPGRGLYCNRTLNLRAISCIGYDMDYTLVHYHIDWERRAYEHMRNKLVAFGWPVADAELDPDLVVRGLVIDTELGNLLKVNRFGYVKSAVHGTEPLGRAEIRNAYAHLPISLADRRYPFLNTLFALSEGCMFAQMVDRLDRGALAGVTSDRPGDAMGYAELYRRIRASLDETHMEGVLKAEIIADPERYVELDEETVLALLDQYHAGKRLLLITNSEWPYAAAMMRYAFDRFLPKGMGWRDLFELIIAGARKPEFFQTRGPVFEILDDAGNLRPHNGPLKKGGCYFGGNAAIVEQHLGVGGDGILYLGDHMFGDVHVTKSLHWRTGLILRELEGELRAVEEGRADQKRLASLMADKEALEWEQYQLRLGLQRLRLGYGPQPAQDREAIARRLAELRAAFDELDDVIAPLARAASQALNPRWGLLMRAGNDKSQLARQIEKYADVYTSRVSNFLYATPFVYLRSRRGSLPHDPVPSRLV